ncbi:MULTISPECIES: hypothetical protein [unclassified Mesorhizobium]|uniref:hypothetical protein n=1 Tax=unclassified Mesorhizobium TaxID=325217 RepID=UPI000FE2BA6F|nr:MULTISPECIES: hypothetical protein [unclassified Mesorhizobium]RWF33775.1 MAG: hypothetical protein EOS45_02255 [Mesorhizobium sp.]RWX70425.1 hypothetical protein EN780_03255 [Mesorhizobium sp. M4B.F.Ca.ET.089.01.1.1]TIX43174.1 MAG: hypothetical protein E5V40_04330 [Mesorhizobium sp.]
MELDPQTTAKEPNKFGRPSKSDYSISYDSPLYKLLLNKLPPKLIKGDRIDTLALSKGTQNARFTVYRWFKEQRLSPRAVKSLLALCENGKGKLKKVDLIPFLDL